MLGSAEEVFVERGVRRREVGHDKYARKTPCCDNEQEPTDERTVQTGKPPAMSVHELLI